MNPTLTTKDGIYGVQTGNQFTNAKYADPSVLSTAGATSDQLSNISKAQDPVKPVSTLSSTQGQTILDNNTTQHNADIDRLQSTQNPQLPQNQTQTDPAKQNNGYTPDEAKSLGIDLNTANYDPTTNTYTPKNTLNITNDTQNPDGTRTLQYSDGSSKIVNVTKNADGTDEYQEVSSTPNPNQQQQDQVDAGFEADQRQIEDTFSQQADSLDAANTALVDSIKGIYDSRMQDQKDLNARSLQDTTTYGIRSGGSRYTPEVNGGILSADERAGLQKLNDLGSQEVNALAQANSALQDKKYSLFVEKRNELKDIRDQKQNQLERLQDQAIAEKKAQTDRAQKLEDDSKANVLSILSNATQAGADPATINKIKTAQSPEEALSYAAPFLQKKQTLDDEYKKAQIANIYSDIKKNNDVSDGTKDPAVLLAWANQYAATGQLTGFDADAKKNIGVISNIAKELPKPDGAIVDRNTGVKSSKTSSSDEQAISAGYNLVNSTLPSLIKAYNDVQGTLNAGPLAVTSDAVTFGLTKTAAAQHFDDLRTQFLNQLLLANSGKVVSDPEMRRYQSLLPSRSSLNIGGKGVQQLNDIYTMSNNGLNNYLNNNGLSIYGFTPIKASDGNTYKVGQIVDLGDGTKARINVDGSASLVSSSNTQ